MTSKGLDVPSLLRTAFLKAELAFLEGDPLFADAVASAKTADDFEALCDLGEKLLKSQLKTNPSAHQLREGLRKATL